MFDIKSFYEATSVADAIRALKADEDAELISGGTDVLIRLREGKKADLSFVSIHNIAELKKIEKDACGNIIIGAGASFSDITNNEIIKEGANVLGEAADTVGGPQIRNVGTIGGNICNGVTSADTASTLLSFDAAVVLEGPEGVREVAVREFYCGPGKTVRRHDEVCTSFKIKKEEWEGFEGHYIKYGKRNAMEIATLGCVVRVKLSADKKCIEDARLAFGVAGPTPLRCLKAEAAVKGMSVSDADIYEKLATTALTEVNPRSSWRASKEFRLQLISELSKRALREAILKSGADESKVAPIPYKGEENDTESAGEVR
ncbi:MAG: xanthine dehydrogenase subunit XdhB [Candidatus Avilachnospira sp.]|jgi:xanthine dehydrogenase FAD-binding subunit